MNNKKIKYAVNRKTAVVTYPLVVNAVEVVKC